MRMNLLATLFLLNIVSAVPLPTALNTATNTVSSGVTASRIPFIAPFITPANSKNVKESNSGKHAKRPIYAVSRSSCTPHVVKRQNGLVQNAVLAAKERIESGLESRTWLTMYGGQPAVLKILRNEEWDSEAKVREEVRNLKMVHQFLGWGHNLDKSIFYIVMRRMGEPFESANERAQGTLSKIKSALEENAYKYYETTYGLKHLDFHEHNYVFHETSPGEWRAELIDWAEAGSEPGMKKPCEGEAELISRPPLKT